MSTIQDLFQQAQLAEAAYANFSDFPNPKDALIAKGFSDKQATDFLNHWGVVSQQPNTVSGFSATVFKSLDNPGQYVFAVRGSENLFSASGSVDWLGADIADIGGQGIALHQALDLYNYIQSLKTPQGTVYKAAYLKTDVAQTAALPPILTVLGTTNPYYLAAKAQLESAGYWVVDGIVNTIALGNSDQVLTGNLALGNQPTGLTASTSFEVLGHSLGGHLAMIMQRLDAANVTSVETFNPPFFDPSISNQFSERFFSQLQQAEIAAYGSSNIATSFDPALYHGIKGVSIALNMEEPCHVAHVLS